MWLLGARIAVFKVVGGDVKFPGPSISICVGKKRVPVGFPAMSAQTLWVPRGISVNGTLVSFLWARR